MSVDLVVLSVGLEARSDAGKVGALLGVQKSADGFMMEAHPKLRPVESLTEGVFIAGTTTILALLGMFLMGTVVFNSIGLAAVISIMVFEKGRPIIRMHKAAKIKLSANFAYF